MKRFFCLLLCAALLLPALPAFAGGVSDVMAVANCNEYVSLRQLPDKSSKRLAKVYLGELVSQCHAAENDFIRCDYHGTSGYIMAKYLKTTGFTNGDELLYNQMVVNCEEWVSLREYADTKSKRLEKVPVGAVVTSCVREGDYVLCTYKKKVGYIPGSYLRKANYTISTQNTSVVSKAKSKGYPAYQNPMEVVNTKDWVSLREKASASSTRLAKVPLGARVSHCVQVSDSFVYCQYRNIWGYIKIEYLRSHDARAAAPAATATPVPAYTVTAPTAIPQTQTGEGTQITSFSQLPAWPPYTTFLQAGETVVHYHADNGYTVVVQRVCGEDTEELMAICYDATARPVWQAGDKVQGVGELHPTGAFIAGTAEKPQVVLFTSGKGFTAYDVGEWHDVQWACREGEALNVSGGISAAVDADGTVYVIGYYNRAPICISPEGQLLWTGQNEHENIYWPWWIDVAEDHIEVYFDTPAEEETGLCDVISYGKDGQILVVQRKPRESQEENG